MTRFPGLVAIVTGGGRGIGAETARRYVAEGGRVLICDIDPETAEATASELGDTAAAFAMDVADPNACAEAVEKAVDREVERRAIALDEVDGVSTCAPVLVGVRDPQAREVDTEARIAPGDAQADGQHRQGLPARLHWHTPMIRIHP